MAKSLILQNLTRELILAILRSLGIADVITELERYCREMEGKCGPDAASCWHTTRLRLEDARKCQGYVQDSEHLQAEKGGD